MVKLTGEMLIGGRAIFGTAARLRAFDPVRGVDLEPVFGAADVGLVNRACTLAESAFDAYRIVPLEARAAFLEQIAENILALDDVLIERAHLESALPKARLEGERGRTVGQLRFFASLVREGRWLSATLDSAMPERTPLPRPDLRLQKVPLGPVAVFGASNFPLAFSVAGGDTASALAAGCPVVVKAHPAHLGTSELVARAIQHAVQACGLPEGVFSLLIGASNETGAALVSHPAIRAVGFTGSRSGGLALADMAAKRWEPIPVYAEMSSINPFFVLPGALEHRLNALASGLADSVTLGVGQFCTNPGLIVMIDSAKARQFIDIVGEAMARKGGQTMLTSGIAGAYDRSVDKRAGTEGVRLAAAGSGPDGQAGALPALFVTSASDFLTKNELGEEIFGPTSLVVLCTNEAQLVEVAHHVEGQLTCTLQMEPDDYALAGRLMPILERKAGRILANGFPTGVEVSHAMVHGGPYPATSDPRSTSVGASAMERFLRPVCYQDLPAELLPASVQDDNPLALWRVRNGQLMKN
ncbi:Alpha-ketoglutaric semialdehyde dehydrogenase [Pandoraea eparura]|jgi:NADP-dependent aldehyde dehydrogenase|uniref:Alpha-ketoglutaric semialdehyde dehydrogenase n=1 Tax=Pandoraea eparura TaxID=2508291 RepID=A0A5E4VWT2_9BURK|nr:Alpha-ketoglutaric semialdehyde dehydrogenase [Pandoraea eparura]